MLRSLEVQELVSGETGTDGIVDKCSLRSRLRLFNSAGTWEITDNDLTSATLFGQGPEPVVASFIRNTFTRDPDDIDGNTGLTVSSNDANRAAVVRVQDNPFTGFEFVAPDFPRAAEFRSIFGGNVCLDMSNNTAEGGVYEFSRGDNSILEVEEFPTLNTLNSSGLVRLDGQSGTIADVPEGTCDF